MGPDPIALQPLVMHGEPRHFVSILRGRDALVLLDAQLHEIDRASTPASPTGLAVSPSGEVFVSGEASSLVARYALLDGRLKRTGAIQVADVVGIRNLAQGPEGLIYGLDEWAGTLITLDQSAFSETTEPAVKGEVAPICAGPFHVERLAHHLIVNCLIDHTLVVRRVAEDGRCSSEGEVRLQHDGPIWSFAAEETEHDVWMTLGGVEDHPLDRSGGSFGYIDSFVYLYRIADGQSHRMDMVNTSELGVITPKAMTLQVDEKGAVVHVTGYGNDRRAELRWKGPLPNITQGPEHRTYPLLPGTAAMVQVSDGMFVYANPLLDAWILEQNGSTPNRIDVKDDSHVARSDDSRLGEALIFTTLMAPWNKTEGPLSRFTCETCHFEGTTDGRTHHTGRGDVHATTKPLLGLFNNRPHFTRALDPNLTSVADNEFRVAGAKSDHDPWFSLGPKDVSWISDLRLAEPESSPERLRRAFMTFLMEFSHRPNPAVLGRSGFTELERQGATVFQQRCEQCHSARLVTDDAQSVVSFDKWEQLIFTREDPIVWANSVYKQTGVTPYVHKNGARITSLRRLYKKQPYFTNGSAKSVKQVLERVRFSTTSFYHDNAPEAESLDELSLADQDALLAFMRLL